MKTLRLTCTLTLAILAAQSAPVAAQRSAEDWPPEYAHGRFLIDAGGTRDGCVPNRETMTRIIEGELARGGLSTGPNVHEVTIRVFALGVDLGKNSKISGCAVQARLEVQARATSPSGKSVRAVLHDGLTQMAEGPKSNTNLVVRDFLRNSTAEIVQIVRDQRRRTPEP